MKTAGMLRKLYHNLLKLPIFGSVIRKLKDVIYSRLERRITYRGFSDLFILNAALRKDIQNLNELCRYALNITHALSQRLEFLNEHQNDLNVVVSENKKRIEFVRNEVLFEIRKQMKVGAMREQQDVVDEKLTTLVINKHKLDAESIRLNVGCGHKILDGYVNVDMRNLPGVDVISCANQLDFAKGKIDEIYASHLIEHFTEIELINDVLPNWKANCNDGAVIRVIVPDTLSMISDVEAGTMTFDDFKLITLGAQDYDGDFHYSLFSFDSLKEIFERVGFKSILMIEKNRKNGLCKEFELECKV